MAESGPSTEQPRCVTLPQVQHTVRQEARLLRYRGMFIYPLVRVKLNSYKILAGASSAAAKPNTDGNQRA